MRLLGKTCLYFGIVGFMTLISCGSDKNDPTSNTPKPVKPPRVKVLMTLPADTLEMSFGGKPTNGGSPIEYEISEVKITASGISSWITDTATEPNVSPNITTLYVDNVDPLEANNNAPSYTGAFSIREIAKPVIGIKATVESRPLGIITSNNLATPDSAVVVIEVKLKTTSARIMTKLPAKFSMIRIWKGNPVTPENRIVKFSSFTKPLGATLTVL